MFTNPVSAFVPPTEGCFLFFTAPARLCWAEDGQMVIGGVPVKWLRCTNKTDEAESRDAYHPLRGCLTAGVAAGATFRRGYIHTPAHFYNLHIFYCDYFAVTCTFFWFCRRQKRQRV